MPKGETNSNGKPWLGGLYHKFEKMYDDIDHSSQDRVKFARTQLQTVGENVKKLGSHLPFPSFLSSKPNSAPPLGRKTIIKPKLSINVIDLEYPTDAETELRGPSSREFNATTTEMNSKLIDNHWLNENVEYDSNGEKLSSSDSADSMCSKNDSSESFSLSSSTVIGQEAETEIKNKMMTSSSNAYESTLVEVDDVKSWSPCSFVNKDEEDTDSSFTRIPFRLPTDDQYPESSEPISDHVVVCAPNVAIMCQSELTKNTAIFTGNSSLEESLNLVEESHCEDYFDISGNAASLCDIPSLDCPPIQQTKSYSSVDDSASSCTNISTFQIAGESNNSVGVLEDQPMEKVDLVDNAEQNNLSNKVDRIQISDKVDRIPRGVSVINDINFSMSSRRVCFNPYKKMFQNPFTSKKRLEKDYKLLPVWYGDIDTELSEITQSKETTSQYKTVSDDTEWEIV